MRFFICARAYREKQSNLKGTHTLVLTIKIKIPYTHKLYLKHTTSAILFITETKQQGHLLSALL